VEYLDSNFCNQCVEYLDFNRSTKKERKKERSVRCWDDRNNNVFQLCIGGREDFKDCHSGQKSTFSKSGLIERHRKMRRWIIHSLFYLKVAGRRLCMTGSWLCW
jgi:hypothetical protein